jgi:hypothetical protein
MKRILKLDRLRLRGLSSAKDEVLLTATAQNLKRLAKLLYRAPPPVAAVLQVFSHRQLLANAAIAASRVAAQPCVGARSS